MTCFEILVNFDEVKVEMVDYWKLFQKIELRQTKNYNDKVIKLENF